MKIFNLFVVLISLAAGSVSCKKMAHPEKVPIVEDIDTDPVEMTMYDSIIVNQVRYIISLQMQSGAIKDNEASNSKICGYFANIACRALLKKPTEENVSIVKKYMIWYMSKLNGSINPITGKAEVPGSVYDYYAPNETTNGTYDSVDSYAATFLSLAKEFAQLSVINKDWLVAHSTQLNLIGSAMEKCIDNTENSTPTAFTTDDNDGLSVDSYVHGAKYTMDNAEVNEGLKSMVWLQTNVMGSATESTHYQTLLSANTSAIESQLWRGDRYNWNDDGTNGTSNSNWTNFYADATCQLYPALFGVIDPFSERANILYSTFNIHYPNWSNGTVYSGAYPWAVIAYAAATINDKLRVDEYIKHILTLNNAGKQKDYWYSTEAAFTILAADKIKNQGDASIFIPTHIPESLNLALNKTATASTSFNDPNLSIDGNLATRWSLAAATENEWYKVDLGSEKSISKIDIKWEGAFATDYTLQISTDNVNFTDLKVITGSLGGNVSHTFNSTNARYIKILLIKAALPYPMSFWEFEVYK